MQIKRDGNTIHFQYNNNEGDDISGVIVPIYGEPILEANDTEVYWDFCAQRIHPGGHTIEEAIRWAEENWDLEPLPDHHPQIVMQRANYAANNCPEKYGQPHVTPEMRDEEIAKSIAEGHARQKAAQQVSDKDLGIRLRGYHLSDTPRNQSLFQEGWAEFDKQMKRHHRWMREHHPEHPMPPHASDSERHNEDAYIFIEEMVGNVSSNGVGAGPLMRKLGQYIGIAQQDIDARSPRFMGYVHLLAEEGVLPTMQEFGQK